MTTSHPVSRDYALLTDTTKDADPDNNLANVFVSAGLDNTLLRRLLEHDFCDAVLYDDPTFWLPPWWNEVCNQEPDRDFLDPFVPAFPGLPGPIDFGGWTGTATAFDDGATIWTSAAGATLEHDPGSFDGFEATYSVSAAAGLPRDLTPPLVDGP